MPSRRAVRCVTFAVALALGGQSAVAQVDEADRLQRCVNNREAIPRIVAELEQYYNDEQAGRARQTLGVIAELGNSVRWAQEEHRPERVQEYLLRVQEAGRSVAVVCTVLDAGCPVRMATVIQQRLDEWESTRGLRRNLLRLYEEHRNNLIALRCDQAANTSFTLAGTWTGSNGLTYEMGQSGNTIGWRVESISETGTGSITDRTITASWNGNWGPGSSSGTVSVDANGAANRINWNNGVTFTR